MKGTAIYTSASTTRSLWQEYRIYDDRLEFDTLFGRMTIPFEQVMRANVAESDVKGLLKGDLHLKDFHAALKLDWANFLEHVVLDRSTGFLRRILFTPDDPKAFLSILQDVLERHRQRNGAPHTDR